jgi:gag-polypeptide of LTR copia-type
LNPANIWEDFRNIHETRGLSSRLALHDKFLWLSKAEDQPMQNWISIVRHTAFHLTKIGVEVSEEDFILVLTQGLPVAYETFVEVCQLALNHDHESQTTQKDTVFYVNLKKTPIECIICCKCQKKGHYQSQCPKNKSSDQANVAAMKDSENGIW